MVDPIYNRPIRSNPYVPEVIYAVTSGVHPLTGFYYKESEAISAALRSGGEVTEFHRANMDAVRYRAGAPINQTDEE